MRPTARRLRESLFEVLGPRIEHSRFLDLCSGSGAVGIEALSRGAGHATFVDRSAKMCNFVRSNLELCDVPPEQFVVVEAEASHFLSTLKVEIVGWWDVIYFDPPYSTDYSSIIEVISTSGILKKKRSILVVEHSVENPLSDRLSLLYRWRVIRQGESYLSFYERKK